MQPYGEGTPEGKRVKEVLSTGRLSVSEKQPSVESYTIMRQDLRVDKEMDRCD